MAATAPSSGDDKHPRVMSHTKAQFPQSGVYTNSSRLHSVDGDPKVQLVRTWTAPCVLLLGT